MKMNHRRTLMVLLLVGLAALLVMGAGPPQSGAQVEAPLAQEAETPTPLPTLPFEEDPPSGGAIFAVGLMVVCSMMGLLVFGALAATWFVNLRRRIKD